MKKLLLLYCITIVFHFTYAQDKIKSFKLITPDPLQYKKTEFEIEISAAFKNPYISSDIKLDMILTSPSGKEVFLPCFYFSGDPVLSFWKARFTACEAGVYSYYFRLSRDISASIISDTSSFTATASTR